jgi:hypothetical protein
MPTRRGESDARYRVWMPESVPPGFRGEDRPGRWVAESSWPSPRIANRVFHLAPERLGDMAPRRVS